jgi:cytoskeletal protein CcmA (bactofilin family)
LFRRNNRPTPDAIEVIIGPRATYTGTLRSDTSIRVDGVVESGLLQTAANVILTETARVACEIHARTVSIRGRFNGIIHADRAELLAGCHVSGALYVNSFLLEARRRNSPSLDRNPAPCRRSRSCLVPMDVSKDRD